MSRIAEKAAMSVGHIYQCFENKEAIMIALCERDLSDFILHIEQAAADAGTSIDTIVNTLSDKVIWLMEQDRVALTLEVMAEAGRNPKFFDLLSDVDQRMRKLVRNIIEPLVEGLTAHEIDIRVETLFVMTRGLAIHVSTRSINRNHLLAAGFERAFRGVLSPP